MLRSSKSKKHFFDPLGMCGTFYGKPTPSLWDDWPF